MTKEEKDNLSELLDVLAKEKCDVERGMSNSCYIDCPFYVDGAYGGECAIGIVNDALN
jgi:hypothetical protein